jgi:predicted thioesterase
MKDIYKIGDRKEFKRRVSLKDIASFDEGDVHQVYATFALGRDAEWCSRLFVLDMKEADEEGIGTFLKVQHHSPALLNEEVQIEATIQSLQRNELICAYIAKVGERIIASGETGQKIIKKDKLRQLFDSLK